MIGRLARGDAPHEVLGLAAGLVSTLVIITSLGFAHEHLALATPALLLVIPVLISAVLGGRRSAIAVAVFDALSLNFVFIRPFFTLQIGHVEDVVAFVAFVAVAAVVGTLVARLVEVTDERERFAAEAQRVAVLEEVHRQRAALLRSVSHDLRTPLVTIEGVASELRAGDAFDESTRNDLLDLVLSEAERLDRLVANLLSFSRIDSGTLEPRLDAVDLGEVIAEVADRLRRLFSGSSLEIALQPDLPILLADAGLLDQVLTNLLENAVRHGGRHARVRAACTTAPDGSRWIEVTVDDDGPGLGSVDRDQLFEPWTGHGRSSLSGVGLAICKAVVTAHGGTIAADDSPSGGARFSFNLPVFRGPDDTA